MAHRLRGEAARAADDAGGARGRVTRPSSRRDSRSAPRSRHRASARAACASAPGSRPTIRSTWSWESVPAGPGARLVGLGHAPGRLPAAAPGRLHGRVVRGREPGRGSAPTGQGRRRGRAAPAAAQAADRVVTGSRRGQARGSDRGGRGGRGAGTARRRGPRQRQLLDRGQRPPQRIPASRAGRPGHHAAVSRCCWTSAVGWAAIPRTSPGRSG